MVAKLPLVTVVVFAKEEMLNDEEVEGWEMGVVEDPAVIDPEDEAGRVPDKTDEADDGVVEATLGR